MSGARERGADVRRCGGAAPPTRSVIACVFAFALLAGCVSYTPRPLAPATTMTAFAARDLHDPALAARVALAFPSLAQDWPPMRWQRSHLLAIALANSHEVAAARAQLAVAQAQADAAGWRELPGLSVQTEYARRERKPWLYGFALDIPIAGGNRRAIERAASAARVDAARQQVLESTWATRSRLMAAVSAVIAAREREQLLGRLVSRQRARVALAVQRTGAGEDAASAELPAREARLQGEALHADARTDGRAAHSALARALDVPAGAMERLALDWSDWGDPPPYDDRALAGLREGALLSRADLAVAIDAYAIAELELQRAVAAQWPQLVVSPGYEWDHGIVRWPLALGIEFMRPARSRAVIAAQLAERDRVGEQLLAVQATILADVDAALAADALARTHRDAARDAVAEGEQNLRHRERALQLGAIDRGDVLSSDILVLDAQLALLDRRRAAQAARLTLEDALRTPLSGPELAMAVPDPATGVPR